LCRTGDEEKWNKAVYWVFDAPSNQVYEERMKNLQKMKENFPSFVKVVEATICKGKKRRGYCN
jgi:hypothetical protein